MTNRTALGKKAEDEAERFLKESGYRVIARNVRARFGEIDVVAEEGPTLCFVEIRSRSESRFGWPEETVNRLKQRRLVRLAQWYLQRIRRLESPVRFDVLSILTGPDGLPVRTRLIKGAFTADGF